MPYAAPDWSINLIRAFTGPRHARLEAIWRRFGYLHRRRAAVHIHDNLGAAAHHDACLNAIWEAERLRPTRFCLITEFDFLPSDQTLSAAYLDGVHTAVAAAEYCTRNAQTRNLVHHNCPGAWYLAIDKTLLHSHGSVVGPLDFTAGGPRNDPANVLDAYVAREYPGRRVQLLPTGDCYPRHYGVSVGVRGEHLFWSRHYNDQPDTAVAGFNLRPILEGVDAAITRAEEQWR